MHANYVMIWDGGSGGPKDDFLRGGRVCQGEGANFVGGWESNSTV